MKKYRSILYSLLPLLSLLWCHRENLEFNDSRQATATTAEVNVFAEEIGSYDGLEGVEVIALETSQVVGKTDEAGQLRFNYPVGQKLTLLFKRDGFQTSQSATFLVSKEGFRGRHKEISYQAIPKTIFLALSKILSIYKWESLDPNKFQLIATVTAVGKTLNDAPQGVAGAILQVTQKGKYIGQEPLYYFGTLADKTFPIPFLKETTADGGVFGLNLEEGTGTVTAQKSGVRFSIQRITCRLDWWKKHAPGEQPLLNLSPPQGPTELKPTSRL